MIAIDPGYAKRGKGSACARFIHGELRHVWFARPSTFAPLLGVHTVVWERPQVDRRTRSSVPSIVRLAAEGGTLAGLYAGATGAAVVAVSPTEWKGAVSKPVHHKRMWRALSEAERAVLGVHVGREIDAACRRGALDRWSRPGASYYPASFAEHNLLDAVGIGLWRLGRIDTEGKAR